MKRTLVLALAAASVVAAGCGSSNDNSSTTSSQANASSSPAPPPSTSGSSGSSGGGGGSSSLKLSADPSGQLKFDKSSLSAKAGKVTITMDNPSSVPHGVAVEGNGVDKDGQIVNKGGKSTVSVTLKKGKYTFYCPVPGHRQAGMQGSLTVQ